MNKDFKVKDLSTISGLSTRTIQWYDKIGILKPDHKNGKGYRFYNNDHLLKLQQILFLKEIGFELKEIKKIINHNQFDKMKALQIHRNLLKDKIKKTKILIKTIDQTILFLTKGDLEMTDSKHFRGFKEEKDNTQKYLVQFKD